MTHTKRWSKRIRDMKTIVIAFLNKSEDQLRDAMAKLRVRYKRGKMELRRKLVGVLYNGEIIIKY